MFYYKDSLLATLFMIPGNILFLVTLAMVAQGSVWQGILCWVICLACLGIAKWIASEVPFNTWWHQIEVNNLEPQIAYSTPLAIQVYQKNPQPRTLKKIRALNPAAADYLEQSIAKEGNKAFFKEHYLDSALALTIVQLFLIGISHLINKNTVLGCVEIAAAVILYFLRKKAPAQNKN